MFENSNFIIVKSLIEQTNSLYGRRDVKKRKNRQRRTDVRKLNFTPESKVLLFVGVNQVSFVRTPPTPIIRYFCGMSFFIKTITFLLKQRVTWLHSHVKIPNEFVKDLNNKV